MKLTELDERVPPARTLDRDEALAELTRRYFMSRGPATAHDFAKWSGLTLIDARSGLDAVKTQLEHEVLAGQSYWFSTSNLAADNASPTAYLLSVYDEYISGYKDRSAIGDERSAALLGALGNALAYVIVVDGQLVGSWKRTFRKSAVIIEANVFTTLTPAQDQAVAAAAHRYGAFLGLRVTLA